MKYWTYRPLSFHKLSIRKKLILTIMGISSMVLMTTLSIFITSELKSIKKNMLEDLSTLADLVGKNNTGALLFQDNKAASENLLALKAKPHIVSAHFFLNNNQLFAQYHRNKLNRINHIPAQVSDLVEKQSNGHFYLYDHIHIVKRITFKADQTIIGLIYIQSDRDIYWERVKEYAYTIVIMITILLLLTFAFAFQAQKSFTDPILKLLTSMKQVSENQDYSKVIDNEHYDEFGQLIKGYNTMLTQLEQHQKMARNYQSDLEQRVEERTKQLQKARDEALSASRTKSVFLANMSHEIRTPMNAILGYAQLLQQSELSKDQFRQLNVIDKSGKHLLSLINGILELSKVESGSVEINNSDFDLIDLIHNLESMFKIQCMQKKINWNLDCFSHQPVLVNGDQGKLRQVLINLLGNAFKFTDKGEILLRVENTGENLYKFTVKDTGMGIEEKSLSHIFDAFHQEDPGQEKGGTGLGLDISKRYIKLLSGDLQVSSTVNKGSSFFFEIELLPANEAFTQIEQSPQAIYTLKSDQKLTALVVDDIKDNSELLSTILHQIGFKVDCADNGQAALLAIDKNCPDIIFLDIRMPVMNGIETIERIRMKYPSSQVKCIAISAANMRHQSSYFMEKGFDLFVSKPFRFDAIYFAITEALGIELQTQEVFKSAPYNSNISTHSLKLNEGLIENLHQAAEFGQLTELGNLIGHLKDYGAEGETMANHLDLLINSADLDGILEYVENLTNDQHISH